MKSLSQLSIVLPAAITLVLGFGLGRLSTPSSQETLPDRNGPVSSDRHQRADRGSSSSLLGHLSLRDIQERLLQAVSEPQNKQNPAHLNLLITEWAKLDPMGALAFAQEQEREDWLSECLTLLGRNQAEVALEWIDHHITAIGLQNHLTGAVYRGLVQEDPLTAISRIEMEKSGARRDQLLSLALDEWAQQDIDGAFAWIADQEITPFLSAAYGQVLGRYIEQSPKEATVLVSGMPDNTDKVNFANRTGYHLGRNEPEEALAWAEGLPVSAKQFALMGLMESWASGNDSLAALEYAKSQTTNQNGAELFAMATMKLAQANPDLLAQELSSLDENQQEIAAKQLAQVYSSHSAQKTTAWLETLAQGHVRDAALKISLNAFRHNDIEQAFALSETFSDESLRRAEIQQVLLDWLPTDPEAAALALEDSAALPDSQKRMIRDDLARKAPEAADFLLPTK